jgi:excisionase family DNA binding protein
MLLTLAEVARRLGVSAPTARKIVRQMPAVNIGRSTRYPLEAVLEFANSGTIPAPAKSLSDAVRN